VLKFGDKEVGPGQPTYMIAEVGINHNADLQLTKRLIDAAFATGWDCVKFQKRNPDKCVPEAQKGVMKDTPWGRMTYLEYKHKIEFGQSEFNYIDYYCKNKPIDWTASVWDFDSLDFVDEFDVPFLKLPSALLTRNDLLVAACHQDKPLVVSTGMSTIEEVDHAVGLLKFHNHSGFALMHTNSAYPSPPGDINLRAIQTLKERYGCVVGYSGHEYGLDPTVLSVAFGADIIERHITLDHNMWGTDQKASLEVHAMDMLHKRIQEAVVCLGDGIKRVAESEKPIREKLRG